MPRLSDLTDYQVPQPEEVPADIPRVYITKDDAVPSLWDNFGMAGVEDKSGKSEHPLLKQLFGLGGEERYQLWPEKVVREGLTAAGDVMSGKTPEWAVDPVTGDVHTSPQMVEKAQAISALAGTGGLAGTGKKTGTTLGVVPVDVAKKLNFKTAEQHPDVLKTAVDNTPNAYIDPDGHLVVGVSRRQTPDQEMAESVRGGVFYLPEGNKGYSYTGKNGYGGSQKIEGETAFKNPLIVKGATGGKAPERAYNEIMGDKNAYENMRKEAVKSISIGYAKSNKFYEVENFLQKYAPEMADYAQYIIDNSKHSNQLPYALQEAAVASAARKAGHDGIVGYSEGRGSNKGKPYLSEIFDTRENRYPSPSGDYSIHPELYTDSKVGTALQAAEGSRRAFLRPALKYKDRLYKGKEGQSHQDVIPEALYPEFNRMAMSGEDISHYNFGFHNDKGHFLNREDALKYGIDTGLIDPQAGKFGALTSTLMADSSKPGTAIEAMAKTNPADVWWHGSASGDLRGGSSGLHLGTQEAAKQALEARIGIPADGKGWTGDREYGKTLLAGQDTLAKLDLKGYNKTGYNVDVPKEDFYPSKTLKYPDGSEMPLTVKPEVAPYKIVGNMSNSRLSPHEDSKANGYMSGQLKRGSAKNGYYYTNAGEDSGSVSAVVPNGNHVVRLNADSSKESAAIQSIKEPFYSALEHNVAKINQSKMTGDQWLGTLSNKPGVKPEELDWTGLKDFLKENGKALVTKEQIEQHLASNKVELKEINKGGNNDPYLHYMRDSQIAHELKTPADIDLAKKHNANFRETFSGMSDREILKLAREAEASKGIGETKYHSYQLPGGENYREMLLTLPTKSKLTADGLPHDYQLINENAEAIKLGFKIPEGTPERWSFKGPDISSQIFKTREEAVTAALRNAKQQEHTGAYKSSHWDEPNILAHVRMNDRTMSEPGYVVQNTKSGNKSQVFATEAEAKDYQAKLPASVQTKIASDNLNKKSLHLEEIQSDWHQQGRDRGYSNPQEYQAKQDSLKKQIDDVVTERAKLAGSKSPEDRAKYQAAHEKEMNLIDEYNKLHDQQRYGVPDAPFKKTWHELALKRMIREAAEKGYDRLSWTPGEAQAARYDLSKSVDTIKYQKQLDGNYNIVPFKNGEPMHGVERAGVKPSELDNIVGKEVAEKIRNAKGDLEGKEVEGSTIRVLSNQDLKIGGEGMKGFYDQIIPKSLERIGKEHGVKVKQDFIANKEKEWPFSIKVASDGKKYWLEGKDPRLDQAREVSLSKKFDSFADADTLREKFYKGETEPVHYIDIPQSLKDQAMHKGFPLFSSTHMFTPIAGNPFEKKK